jgi:hypothetical protein
VSTTFGLLLLSQAIYDFIHFVCIVGVKIGRDFISTELFVKPESVADFIVTETEHVFYVLRSLGQVFHVVFKELATIKEFTSHFHTSLFPCLIPSI